MQHFYSQLETLNHEVICISISQQGTEGDLQKANLQVSTFRRLTAVAKSLRHHNASPFCGSCFLTLSSAEHQSQRCQEQYSEILLFYPRARENQTTGV